MNLFYLLKEFRRGIGIEEIGFLSNSLVETLKSPLSFRGHSSDGLRVCLSLAMGISGTIRALPVFLNHRHLNYVDDLLFRRME